MIKRIFAYYIPLTLLICTFFTINRTIMLNDGSTVINFYGFPYAYITSAYACTMCYEIFLFPLAFNLLLIFACICFASLLVRKFIIKYYAHRWSVFLGLIVTIGCVIIFVLNTRNAFFHLRPYTDYEVLKKDYTLGLYP